MKEANSMKRLIVVVFGLFLLVGCTNGNDAEQPITENDHQTENEAAQDNQQQSTDSEGNEEQGSTDDQNTENTASGENESSKVDNHHLEDLEEYDVLAAELDLEHYEGVIESDNKGNRIILFQTEDGKKEYKSIFIKNDHRLKIVHFNDEDDLLYNDVIK